MTGPDRERSLIRDPVLLSAGLCCPLGESLAAASARYGKGRPAFSRAADLLGLDGLPQTIAAVWPFAEERLHHRRMLRMVRAALTDCLSRAAPPAAGWPLWLLVQPWLEGHDILASFLAEFAADKPRGVGRVSVVFGAQAEGLLLLAARHDDVGRGREPGLLVAAVDSYIHPFLWPGLAVRGRLAMPGNPHGFVPGEAAAAVLITPSGQPAADPELGRCRGFFHRTETEKPDDRHGLIGRALGTCLRDAGRGARPDRLIADLDGERWRAEEFGFALAAAGPAIAGPGADPECPAQLMGNTGAAAGLVFTALALAPPPSGRDGALTLLSTASYPTGRRCVGLIERGGSGT